MEKNRFDPRGAILAFSQGEKIKAGLMWASHLLGTLDAVFGGERHEVRQVGRSLVEMVRQEVHLARRLVEDEMWDEVDKAMERAVVMIDSGVTAESVTHLTTALSYVTTMIQRAMQFLNEEKML